VDPGEHAEVEVTPVTVGESDIHIFSVSIGARQKEQLRAGVDSAAGAAMLWIEIVDADTSVRPGRSSSRAMHMK